MERFDRAHFNNQSASHYSYLNSRSDAAFIPWFFPPVPPVLDAEFPILPPFTSGFPAPSELAAFVSDWFYPLLASRLVENDLPAIGREELDAYRSARAGLRNELRAHLAALRQLPSDRREKELAAFAAEQSPRIVELEKLAEKIRRALRRNDLLGAPYGNDDWTAVIGPPQSAATKEEEQKIEITVLRAAAYYQDGLSDAQRRLLREEVVAMETTVNPARVATPANHAQWQLPFSPAPAQIQLVASLPPSLAQKISDYSSAGQSLKSELRATILANIATNPQTRFAIIKELASTQAPRIANLEISAEKIRRELATLPDSPDTANPPSLPPELGARIVAYRTHKVATLQTLYSLLAGKVKPVDPDNHPGSWMQDETAQTEVRTAKSSFSATDFNRVQRRLLSELNREQAGIREALAEHFRKAELPADGKTINDLLKDFEQARQSQESREKYRDYRTAVLMPGLSPEQRRLLFDAAIEELSLPLPAGTTIR